MIDVRSRATTALVPASIVIAVLALVVGAATEVLPLGPLALLLLTVVSAGVLAVLVIANNLSLGMSFLPTIAALISFGVGTGTQSRLVAGLLFACGLLALWIGRGLVEGQFPIIRSPIVPATLALIAVWIISMIYGNAHLPPLIQPWKSFPMVQLGQLAMLVIQALILLLAATLAHYHRHLALATWLFVFGVGIPLLVGHFGHISMINNRLKISGLVPMWLMALAYGQVLFNQRLHPIIRLGLLGFVGLLLYKTLIQETFWLSGWLPSIVALGIITTTRTRFGLPLCIIAGVAAVIWKYDWFYAAVVQSNVDEGSVSRIDIWLQAWDLLQQHLLFGTGPAGYALYYMTFYVGSDSSKSTHSNLVDIAAQTGIVGLIVFCWYMLVLLYVGVRAVMIWRRGFLGGFANAAFGGLFGMAVSLMLGDWLIPFVYNQTITGFKYTIQSWVFLGFMVGLAAVERSAVTEDGNASSSALPAAGEVR